MRAPMQMQMPMVHAHARPMRRHSRGFTLIEVMVAVIVLCVGLLGIARLQAVALSSTSVASKRSIAAIQAASLAALMHENRGYWTQGDPGGALYTILGATVNSAITIQGTSYNWANAPAFVAAGSPTCTNSATPCTPVQMAVSDLQQWATAVNNVLPNAAVLIRCGTVTPVSCMVTISWAENAVAANADQAATAQAAVGNSAKTPAMQIPTYTLYIEP